jgi:hypothetical protein
MPYDIISRQAELFAQSYTDRNEGRDGGACGRVVLEVAGERHTDGAVVPASGVLPALIERATHAILAAREDQDVIRDTVHASVDTY